MPARVLACGASIALPGSPGSQLADGLTPDNTIELDHDQLLAGQLQRLGPAEHAMFTPRWNAFYDTGLDDYLRQIGVDTVVVAGCNYPNCPRGTLFGASERTTEPLILVMLKSVRHDFLARIMPTRSPGPVVDQGKRRAPSARSA